jgi:hypothetical protein
MEVVVPVLVPLANLSAATACASLQYSNNGSSGISGANSHGVTAYPAVGPTAETQYFADAGLGGFIPSEKGAK